MSDIGWLAQHVCDLGAAALERYAKVSGGAPYDAPEYFVPAFILDRLGTEGGTVTLETSFLTLHQWNDGARTRLNMAKRSIEDEVALLRVGAEIGAQRVDMVIYQNELKASKDELDIAALVEFKKGVISIDDHVKIRRILPYIDTCRYGMICGFIHANNMNKYKKMTQDDGDHWFESAVDTKVCDGNPYFVCVRLLENQLK